MLLNVAVSLHYFYIIGSAYIPAELSYVRPPVFLGLPRISFPFIDNVNTKII